MSLGQTVDLIILMDINHINIPSSCVDKMPHPHTVAISIAVNGYHFEGMIRQLGASCHRYRSSINTLITVSPGVIGKLTSASNTGHEEYLMG